MSQTIQLTQRKRVRQITSKDILEIGEPNNLRCYVCMNKLYLDDWVYVTASTTIDKKFRHASKLKPCAYNVGCIESYLLR